MLGREIVAACQRRGAGLRIIEGAADLDITDAPAVHRTLVAERPRVVINAAGYTDVDCAESDPEAAARVNHAGVRNLAHACEAVGATLVHFSTDFVFDGSVESPRRPDDAPQPINAYGVTKLAGERAVAAGGCDHLLIRTSWLFAPHGRNFVRTVLDLVRRRPRLNIVDDQRGSPTYARDLAEMTLDLLDCGARGTLHAANAGAATWYELARATCELAGIDCDIRSCSTSDFPQSARRPRYTVLDLSDATDLIGPPRHWRGALAECLHRMGPRPSEPIAAAASGSPA